MPVCVQVSSEASRRGGGFPQRWRTNRLLCMDGDFFYLTAVLNRACEDLAGVGVAWAWHCSAVREHTLLSAVLLEL